MTTTKAKPDTTFDEVKIGPDVPIYTTGVVCSVLNIPVWVLKQLDKAGIVSPPRDTTQSSRLYSKRELKKVQHCWFYMNKHKVKISGLKVILKMEDGTFKGPLAV